jgi:hypothetical protein
MKYYRLAVQILTLVGIVSGVVGLIFRVDTFSISFGCLCAAGIMFQRYYTPTEEARALTRYVLMVRGVSDVGNRVMIEFTYFLRSYEGFSLMVYLEHPDFQAFRGLCVGDIVAFSYQPDGVNGSYNNTVSCFLRLIHRFRPFST